MERIEVFPGPGKGLKAGGIMIPYAKTPKMLDESGPDRH
jgi:hypothetical protein